MTPRLVALSGLLVLAAGCPPPPAPPPELPAVVRPEPPPAPDVGGERGPAPTVVETPRLWPTTAPELPAATLAAWRERFGCEDVVQEHSGAVQLSPARALAYCCRNAQVIDPAPVPTGVTEAGCMFRSLCSLLVGEADGDVTELATPEALQARFAPVTDPAVALALVVVTQRDLWLWHGDAEDRRMVEDPGWSYPLPELQGTRVVPADDAGFDVLTYQLPICGCRHPLLQVLFHVDPGGTVTQLGMTEALRDRGPSRCVD